MARSNFPGGTQPGPILGANAGRMALTAPLNAPHTQGQGPSRGAQLGQAPAGAGVAAGQVTDVEIVVPVYNEQAGLARSLARLHAYLAENFPLSWMITVADNASTDGTWGIACRLAQELENVRAVHIAEKGRGRALKTVWAASTAAVVAYMDVDLSTDLDALLPLVAPLLSGHSDLAIGSRLAQGARVVRGPKREIISRLYNFLLRATLHNSFSDAQCGFKAARADIARRLLPLVEDNGWFFDTELLVLAERNGLRVHEVAVDWVDDPDSRVDILPTARDDLKGVARMLLEAVRGGGQVDLGPERDASQTALGLAPGRDRPETEVAPLPRPGRRLAGRLAGGAGQIAHFAAVGTVSTVSFALLFALLYSPVGAVGADVIALVLCALGNLAANRRFTFSSGGSARRAAYYRLGLALALLPLASTLLAIGLLSAIGSENLPVDLVVLTMANLSSTIVRFGYLRRATAR